LFFVFYVLFCILLLSIVFSSFFICYIPLSMIYSNFFLLSPIILYMKTNIFLYSKAFRILIIRLTFNNRAVYGTILFKIIFHIIRNILWFYRCQLFKRDTFF